MSSVAPTEVRTLGEFPDLVRRILGGEVLVVRRGLQQAAVFEPIVDATLNGIREAAGEETVEKVRQGGFDRIHEWVKPGDLPALTDAVSKALTPKAHVLLQGLIPRLFPGCGTFYYERNPNVRFHIPYDLAIRHQREFNKFAEKAGQGKIAAHGPHRDQWVDCPDNAINVWVALGPVQRGNGLTVYTDDYQTPFAFKDGYVHHGEKLHKPLSFDLAPGDAVLFLSNHLHGSELNRTDRTRYVVSFRVTFGKPHYPHGHYHHYLHGGLAGGPWRMFAGIPQNLQASFVRYQFRRLRYKITGRGRMTGVDSPSVREEAKPNETWGADASIALADLPVGSIRAVGRTVCVARIGDDQVVALSRFCPHSGGDLTGGWVDEGQVVCPLHNLTFDPETGASPCASLRALRRFPCTVRNGRVHVSVDGKTDSRDALDDASVEVEA
jgi:nitrite reductase/ring-hydroxylating ferredoxin subunit